MVVWREPALQIADGARIMSRSLPLVGRTAAAAAAFVVVGWLVGLLLPADAAADDAMGPAATLGLLFVSAVLLIAPLWYPVTRSRLRGWALLGVLFWAVFGLTTVLTQVESAIFLDVTPTELWVGVLRLTINAAAVSCLAVAVYPRRPARQLGSQEGVNPPRTASWARRWIGVALAYMVLYIVAGLLILPIIRSWYETQALTGTNPAIVFPLQLARGALFVAFVIPLLRSMRVTRRQAAMAMAVMIPLVHGVALLVVPNPFMPDYVRYAHMLEIGWSNFVLSLLIGFLFWNPQARGPRFAAAPSDAA
jgi:hypothetical protein